MVLFEKKILESILRRAVLSNCHNNAESLFKLQLVSDIYGS